MKTLLKTKLLLLIACTMLLLPAVAVSAQSAPPIVLDGTDLTLSAPAQSINGTTFVPLSFLDAMKCEYKSSDNFTSDLTVIRRNPNRTIEFEVDSPYVKLNGKIKKISYAPVLKDNTMMLHLVSLVEMLGGEANWDSQLGKIVIESNKPVKFQDANLEKQIRALAGIATGNIYKSDIDEIKTLELPGKSISNIDGLQYFTNLEYLDLSNNSITDVSPLKALGKLSVLYLKGNKISDYVPITDIYFKLGKKDFEMSTKSFPDPKLEDAIRRTVSVPTGEIPADKLAQIKELDLSNCEISNLYGIQLIPNLTKLNVSSNNISSLSPLSGLANLTELFAASNQIETLTSLSGLKKLVRLDLYNNKISDITPLCQLSQLKELNLSKNAITSVAGLEKLADINILTLSDNLIQDVSPLKNLTKVTELYVGGNAIADYSPLNNFCTVMSRSKRDFATEVIFTDPNLENSIRKSMKKLTGSILMSDAAKVKVLNLNYAHISNLDGIQFFTGLEKLYLANNRISDISALKHLSKLTFLSLNANNLSDISPLGELRGLSYLSLKNNSISDLRPLKALSRLSYLYVGSNPVTDFYPVAKRYSVLAEKDFTANFIKVVLNGTEIAFDSAPVNEGGTVLVQAAPLLKAFYMSLKYDSGSQTLYADSENTNLEMKVGSKMLIVNNSIVQLPVEIKIVNNRMYVPASVVSKNLGAQVKWDGATNSIVLTK